MSTPPLTLRFAEELLFLLPARHRRQPVRLPPDGTSTVGHLVQSAGVPLTETGVLRVDGTPVPPSHIPGPGAVVDVAAVPRPQPLPVPARLLLDVHLGTLARRLRVLGLDTAYADDRSDAELVAQANAEHRVLLTQDRGLLRRRALWRGAYVRGGRPDVQLADVLARFRPAIDPWTRCPACNGLLSPVAKAEIDHLLRPGTRRSYDSFQRCGSCLRLYWPGAHHDRLAATVRDARAVLGRQTGVGRSGSSGAPGGD
ncbi:Mut7-C RNAse domain-containing protein [Streptomyces durbertensis]|uniref:Mut7-C RNAse domain-containing protein n=1 Tax=Streptomyces durbertensis TaxID=2448886 RepID=UPI002B1F2BAA|nr:Mut7-C RNAse domain-containing protein [Streptomyces durbertensis]